MKQTLFIIILSFLLISNSFSQGNPIIDNTLNFKVMPVSLLAYNPRHRVGLEYITQNRWAYSFDFGYGNYALNKKRIDGLKWGKDYSYYELRPEIKYLFVKGKEYFMYAAVEFFHINVQDNFVSGRYQQEDPYVGIFYESASFRKRKTGAHLKGGVNFIALDRLHFDFYGGIGLAKRSISYYDVVNPEESGEVWVEWIPKPDLFEGESIVTHLTLGLKIGYTLWMK
ncbi:hypothetical protein [Marivirga harenae]|uniref:hypothetical protein n=1 Tax=Marivirga harenae TaxID=2010992 RepID=UPI0026DED857|nr:hypothetical protein [Marivirga harenae]WKV11518.1 hypothetical protein Q3Y49_15035 [Marivirga harenae]